MDIQKIMTDLLLCAICLCLSFCTSPDKSINTDYDKLLKEHYALKQELQKGQSEIIDHVQVIQSALAGISEISQNTEHLRSEVQEGVVQMSQAELLDDNIEKIKTMIDKYERENKDIPQLKSTISQLRVLIQEKEYEISGLKELITKQNECIKSQDSQIEQQGLQIEDQLQRLEESERQLKAKVYEQAKSLYDAGKTFESLASELPKMVLKKSKQKIEGYRTLVLNKSLEYYEKAYFNGYDEALSDTYRVRNLLEN